jgi:hypothetical protein
MRQHLIPDLHTGIDKHPSNAAALMLVFERSERPGEAVSKPSVSRFVVGDLLKIKRGISTGCNDFFVLTDDEVRTRRIPKKYLKPVLPTRIPIKSEYFSERDWQALRESGSSCWMLSLPDRLLKEFEPAVRDYLREGIRRGLHVTPTANRLRTWYSLPLPDKPPDVFVTYLFRGSPHFALNGAGVFHLTNILGGRFIPTFDALEKEASVRALNLEAPQWMERITVGREYRGGLRKIEPRELASLPIDSWAVPLTFRRTKSEATSPLSLFD